MFSFTVIALYITAIHLGIDPLYHVLNGVYIAMTVYDAASLDIKLYKLHKTGATMLNASRAEGSSAIGKIGAIGLIVGAVVKLGACLPGR